MGKKFQKLNPSNSRIFIDVKRRKVNFEYPSKHSAFSVCFTTMMGFWLFFVKWNGFFMLGMIGVAILSVIFNINFSFPDHSALFVVLLFAGYFFDIILLSIIFSKSKKLLLATPVLNRMTSLLNDRTYLSTVVTKLETRTYEINDFSNIFLEYWATGEFKKYLLEIEVREEDFSYCKMSVFGKVKKEINEGQWKVKFKFSRIPKTGYLRIDFI